MKEINTPKGVLKYRLPYVHEILYLLDASDPFNPDKGVLRSKADMIIKLGDLVDLSGIEGKPSFDNYLQDPQNSLLALSEIADDIIKTSMECFVKKS